MTKREQKIHANGAKGNTPETDTYEQLSLFDVAHDSIEVSFSPIKPSPTPKTNRRFLSKTIAIGLAGILIFLQAFNLFHKELTFAHHAPITSITIESHLSPLVALVPNLQPYANALLQLGGLMLIQDPLRKIAAFVWNPIYAKIGRLRDRFW